MSVYVVSWLEDECLTCRVFSKDNRNNAISCVNRCKDNNFYYLFAEETIDRESFYAKGGSITNENEKVCQRQ